MPQTIARAMTRSLDAATYEGYRAGFEAARAEAAVLAEQAGHATLAERLRDMRPRPRKGESQ